MQHCVCCELIKLTFVLACFRFERWDVVVEAWGPGAAAGAAHSAALLCAGVRGVVLRGAGAEPDVALRLHLRRGAPQQRESASPRRAVVVAAAAGADQAAPRQLSQTPHFQRQPLQVRVNFLSFVCVHLHFLHARILFALLLTQSLLDDAFEIYHFLYFRVRFASLANV